MLIYKGFHLGIFQNKFILWNEKEIIILKATNLNSAEKESKEILKSK